MNIKDLIERLRNDSYMDDEVRSNAREAADVLELMTSGDVEIPEPMAYFEFDDGYNGYSADQLKDYGNRRAAAAVMVERNRFSCIDENMIKAFDRVIEAHHDKSNPFHNPINADAMTALRILKGLVK